MKIPSKEEYYGQLDSCYLRVEHIGDMGFRITLRNELLLSQDCDTKAGEFIGAIARGLLEVAYNNSSIIYREGMAAAFREILEASSANMTEEQKAVWETPPEELVRIH